MGRRIASQIKQTVRGGPKPAKVGLHRRLSTYGIYRQHHNGHVDHTCDNVLNLKKIQSVIFSRIGIISEYSFRLRTGSALTQKFRSLQFDSKHVLHISSYITKYNISSCPCSFLIF
jgi:hypothetical protein